MRSFYDNMARDYEKSNFSNDTQGDAPAPPESDAPAPSGEGEGQKAEGDHAEL